MTINFSRITRITNEKEFILGEDFFSLVIAENYGIVKILLRFCVPHSNKFLPHNYKITKFFSHAPTDACQYTNLDSPEKHINKLRYLL